MKTRQLLGVTIVMLVLPLCSSQAAGVQPQTETFDLATHRLVIADYLNHYANPWTQGWSSDEWDGWSYNGCGITHHPRLSSNGTWTDLASKYHPLIGPYDASDEAVLRYQIGLAKASGIDAFMIEWDGTSDFQDFPRVNSNSLKLLALAEKMVFGIVIGYDAGRYYTGSGGSFPPFLSNRTQILRLVHDDLAYAITRYGNSHIYLKYHGRPFIVLYNGVLTEFTHDEWNGIIDSLRKEGLDAFYATSNADGEALSYYPTVSGFFRWLPRSVLLGQSDSVTAIQEYAERLRSYGQSNSISLGIGVWPGFDSRPVAGWCPAGTPLTLLDDRRSGMEYNATWGAALKANPDWIVIVTFNDWNEATIVEPSTEFGYQYLYATAHFAAQYKNLRASYDGISVPYVIYNATFAIRQAEKEGRTAGLEDAQSRLQEAEESFDSGEYPVAAGQAEEAYQLANGASIPSVVNFTSSQVSINPNESIQSVESPPYWSYLIPIVVGIVALASIIRVIRKKSHR